MTMSTAQRLLDRETKRIIQEVENEVSGFYKHNLLDLDTVCAQYGIELLEGRFEDDNQSGAIQKKNGDWIIIVNEDDPLNRKRFTIAHELGHYFAVLKGSVQAEIYMEEQGNIIKDYALMKRTEEVEEGTYQIERQANMIAAAILMPDKLVQQLYEKDPKPSKSELAEQFGVSETAMAYKLSSMGIDPLESVQVFNGKE